MEGTNGGYDSTPPPLFQYGKSLLKSKNHILFHKKKLKFYTKSTKTTTNDML